MSIKTNEELVYEKAKAAFEKVLKEQHEKQIIEEYKEERRKVVYFAFLKKVELKEVVIQYLKEILPRTEELNISDILAKKYKIEDLGIPPIFLNLVSDFANEVARLDRDLAIKLIIDIFEKIRVGTHQDSVIKMIFLFYAELIQKLIVEIKNNSSNDLKEKTEIITALISCYKYFSQTKNYSSEEFYRILYSEDCTISHYIQRFFYQFTDEAVTTPFPDEEMLEAKKKTILILCISSRILGFERCDGIFRVIAKLFYPYQNKNNYEVAVLKAGDSFLKYFNRLDDIESINFSPLEAEEEQINMVNEALVELKV